MKPDVSFAKADPRSLDLYTSLDRALGLTAMGLTLVALRPGQRNKVHTHAEQEEAYLVLDGALHLLIDGEAHVLRAWDAARVAPSVRRQLTNPTSEGCLVLAVGAAGEHDSQDGTAYVSFDADTGAPPAEVPLPADLDRPSPRAR